MTNLRTHQVRVETRTWIAGLCLMAGSFVTAAENPLGPNYEIQSDVQLGHSRHGHIGHTSTVRHWNAVAVDASGLDHTPTRDGETRTFGEQLGPARASRAMAIVHIAMFDAMNAIDPHYPNYALPIPRHARGASIDAAVSQAAHDTLAALFPSQAPAFDAELADDLAHLRAGVAVERGVVIGKRSAAAILSRSAGDGSANPEPRLGTDYFPGDAPGVWRQDPISQIPVALGARWSEVIPFVLSHASQFRLPPPPSLASAEYAQAYAEVQALGGDGITTPTNRTPEQTFIGTFWAYDGTPSLCAPPRLYNQIAMQIATQMHTNDRDLMRLLALLNTAMADTAIAAWDSKYYYKFWRPVTGIRESDIGTGPSGLGDGNPNTIGDESFSPLGAPASNLNGPNFTPPFPAYPSGHAAFGGALFQTLRMFYGRDNIQFTFVSDEYNGTTRDNQGNVREFRPRHFNSLSDAETENARSRIYLGIHWDFDATQGITLGREVAQEVYRRAFNRH